MDRNIFELASRAKLRFSTTKGALTVEDLWDLPLTGKSANLDDIARDLNHEVKAVSEEVSFVKPAAVSGAAADVKLAFEVVLHVIGVRVAERDKLAEAAKRAETKQKLLQVLDRKENAELENKSPEEIRAMLAAL